MTPGLMTPGLMTPSSETHVVLLTTNKALEYDVQSTLTPVLVVIETSTPYLYHTLHTAPSGVESGSLPGTSNQ